MRAVSGLEFGSLYQCVSRFEMTEKPILTLMIGTSSKSGTTKTAMESDLEELRVYVSQMKVLQEVSKGVRSEETDDFFELTQMLEVVYDQLGGWMFSQNFFCEWDAMAHFFNEFAILE